MPSCLEARDLDDGVSGLAPTLCRWYSSYDADSDVCDKSYGCFLIKGLSFNTCVCWENGAIVLSDFVCLVTHIRKYGINVLTGGGW